MPRQMISALVAGNIAVTARDPALKAHFQFLKESIKMNMPSIYCRGRTLNKNQILDLVAALEEYGETTSLTGNALKKAREIDDFRPERLNRSARASAANPAGDFKFLRSRRKDVETGTAAISQARITKLREFCDAIMSSATSGGANPDLNLLIYVGYDRDGEKREDDHEKHQASSWLLCLVEATCSVLFRLKHSFGLFATRTPIFKMKKVPILVLWEEDQAPYGEVLISCLAKAYHTSGRGLEHHPAGESFESATQVTHKDWDKYTGRIIKHGLFASNLSEETEAIKQSEKERAEAVQKKENLQGELTRRQLADAEISSSSNYLIEGLANATMKNEALCSLLLLLEKAELASKKSGEKE